MLVPMKFVTSSCTAVTHSVFHNAAEWPLEEKTSEYALSDFQTPRATQKVSGGSG